ncbi:MAG TPA: MFS transporter [Alphaproteobacteria bacterium]|nr:MFS transporter [Alphaproteobacteria bacterium]
MSLLATGLWTVLLGLFVNTAAQAFLYATLPSVGRGIGLAETQTGIILGAGAILGMLTAPAWGFLSERWGRRRVLVTAMSAVGISPLVLALMLGGLAAAMPVLAVFLVLLCARGVQAAFGSALIPVSQAYVADITSDQNRTAGMGLLGATISVGTVGGAMLVWLVGGFSPQLGFATIAALAVAAFILGLLLMPEPRRHVAPERSAYAIPFRAVWPFFVVTALAMTANTIVQPVIGLRLMDQFALPQAEAIGIAGAAVTCTALAMMFSQAVLTPRLKWPPIRMLRVGSLGAALGLAVLAMADGQPLIIAGMGVVGLSLGLVLPGTLAAMSLATGAGAQGKVAGINTLALGIGLALGPVSGTAVYKLGFAAPFWLAGLLALGIAAIAFVLPRRDAGDRAAPGPDRAPAAAVLSAPRSR